jgi:hypothetical protein
VVKFSVQPVVAAVATFAIGRELGREVIGIGGRLKILEMAGSASGRHGFEPAVRRALVAGIAIDSSMRARQREAIIVLLDLLNRNLPSANRVALFAVCS